MFSNIRNFNWTCSIVLLLQVSIARNNMFVTATTNAETAESEFWSKYISPASPNEDEMMSLSSRIGRKTQQEEMFDIPYSAACLTNLNLADKDSDGQLTRVEFIDFIQLQSECEPGTITDIPQSQNPFFVGWACLCLSVPYASFSCCTADNARINIPTRHEQLTVLCNQKYLGGSYCGILPEELQSIPPTNSRGIVLKPPTISPTTTTTIAPSTSVTNTASGRKNSKKTTEPTNSRGIVVTASPTRTVASEGPSTMAPSDAATTSAPSVSFEEFQSAAPTNSRGIVFESPTATPTATMASDSPSIAPSDAITSSAPSDGPSTIAPSDAVTTSSPSASLEEFQSAAPTNSRGIVFESPTGAPTATMASDSPSTIAPSDAVTNAPSDGPSTIAPSDAVTTSSPSASLEEFLSAAPTNSRGIVFGSPTATPTATLASDSPSTVAPSDAVTNAPSDGPSTIAPSDAVTTSSPSASLEEFLSASPTNSRGIVFESPTATPSATMVSDSPSTIAPSDAVTSAPSDGPSTIAPSDAVTTSSPSVSFPEEFQSAPPTNSREIVFEQPTTSSTTTLASDVPSTTTPSDGPSTVTPSDRPSTTTPSDGPSTITPSDVVTTSSPSASLPEEFQSASPTNSRGIVFGQPTASPTTTNASDGPSTTAPSDFVTGSPTNVFGLTDATCERNQRCAQKELKGLCCPTEENIYLSCCGSIIPPVDLPSDVTSSNPSDGITSSNPSDVVTTAVPSMRVFEEFQSASPTNSREIVFDAPSDTPTTKMTSDGPSTTTPSDVVTSSTPSDFVTTTVPSMRVFVQFPTAAPTNRRGIVFQPSTNSPTTTKVSDGPSTTTPSDVVTSFAPSDFVTTTVPSMRVFVQFPTAEPTNRRRGIVFQPPTVSPTTIKVSDGPSTTAPSDFVTGSPTNVFGITDATCERNQKCAQKEVKGLCCPTEENIYLECCGTTDSPSNSPSDVASSNSSDALDTSVPSDNGSNVLTPPTAVPFLRVSIIPTMNNGGINTIDFAVSEGKSYDSGVSRNRYYGFFTLLTASVFAALVLL